MLELRLALTSVALPVLLATAALGCGSDGNNNGQTDTRDTGGGNNACTKDEDCVGKVALTPCREAACNASTKQCEAAPVADGATCSTGNPCKVGETCTAGTCAGGSTKPAECGSRECGTDACNNPCGTCDADEECSDAGQCEADPTACGDITFEGCCTADGQLKYCLDDALDTIDCSANESRSTCGWLESSGGYDCSEQGEPSPDTDAYPYLCPGETAPANACAGRDCGFMFGQACGAGCGEGLACTADGKCEDPCADKECGEFGGKDCGTCTGDEVCNGDGQCGPDVCGTLGFEGCCDGDVTYWCDTNEVLVIDCQSEFESGCGWVPFDEDEGDGDYYYCGGDGEDPGETLPRSCAAYTFVRPGEEPVEPGPEVAPEASPEPGPEPEPEPAVEAEGDTSASDTSAAD